MTVFDRQPFGARATFLGVPRAELDGIEPETVAILGAPFDWGASHRPGARFGPKAIRDSDYIGFDGRRPHLDTGIDALSELGVVDIGDVDVVPGYMEESVDRIRQAVSTVRAAGAMPIVLGGDHTITYPGAGGVADEIGHGDVALIHFDAHADTAPTQNGMLLGHATPMRRLIDSGAVPGHRFVQIGLRGYWPPPDIVAWMREQDMRTYLMADIVERGMSAVLGDAVAHAAADAKGVYVSVDIDVVDPGGAPGTGTPEPGGISPRELLDAVRRLGKELNVVGADVVEVSPPYDPSGITAALANRVVLELLNGIAQRRLATR